MQFRFGQTDIRVTHCNAQGLLADVSRRLRVGNGFALATINLDHIVKLSHSEKYCDAYAAQDFVVADGNPIVWLSKLANRPVELLPGSDLVLPLVRAAAEAGRPVSLLGTTRPALEAAMEEFRAKIPAVKTGVLIAPPMGFDPEGRNARDMLAEIEAIGPGLCLVALGAPKQEIFAALGRKLAPSVGFASIGAGVDFIAGTQQRAPTWVRSIAMEWLWRALSAPKRLVPRYLSCAAIFPGEAAKAFRLRTRG